MDSSAFGRLGDGLGFVFSVIMASIAILFLLGIWKAIEILIWIWEHVSIVVEKGQP